MKFAVTPLVLNPFVPFQVGASSHLGRGRRGAAQGLADRAVGGLEDEDVLRVHPPLACLFPFRQPTANLRTKFVDFRGFDSNRILNSRGGIVRSIGNFPESLSQAILVYRDNRIFAHTHDSVGAGGRRQWDHFGAMEKNKESYPGKHCRASTSETSDSICCYITRSLGCP